MTPSQAAQEKLTSPLTRYGAHDMDCRRRGGADRYWDQYPCSCGLDAAIEREAAAATPSLRHAIETISEELQPVIRGEPEGATEALRHLFFVVERLDKQAEPPYSADRMVKITAEVWRGLVRPAIEIVRARLDEGSATPEQKR